MRAERAETARSGNRIARVALPLALFLGVAGLEIGLTRDRIRGHRAAEVDDLVERIDRRHERLALELGERLGSGTGHARFLALAPGVRALLTGGTEDARTALGRLLLPYLTSFDGIDRLTVLDVEGRVVMRCERLGDGVANLPATLLDPAPDEELSGWSATLGPGEVRVSPLVHDAERVEVTAAKRRVFHALAPVHSEGTRIGTIAVTTYAAPLLEALSAFDSAWGTSTTLVDGSEASDGAEQPRGPDHDASDTTFERALEGGFGIQLASTWSATARAERLGPERALGPYLVRPLLVVTAVAGASWILWWALSRQARLAETERFLARIRAESAKQRALMEAAADLILIVDPRSFELRDWNTRASEVLGLEGTEPATAAPPPLARALADVVEPETFARLRAEILSASARPGEPTSLVGLALRDRAGDARSVDARFVGLSAGSESLVEVALSDRTHEREMERQVQTAERLSALGLLTAGVAHEINNPLEGIANYLRLAERASDDARRGEHLAAVRTGFERIRRIVQDLLSFARPTREASALDLRDVLAEAVGLARLSRRGKAVRIELESADEPLQVRGSAGRLEQVLLNLLLNAEEAARSVVRVEAAREASGAAVVRVLDDGAGIDAEDLPRVFDPFFTRTEGTGLGLAVSYGIVRAHGGELVARNRSEGGAAFELRLPPAGDEADRGPNTPTGVGEEAS